nr:VolA/Pla-1 family phospholipase [Enterovibrio norvegicus]
MMYLDLPSNKTRLALMLTAAFGLSACGESELSGNTGSGVFEEAYIQESLKAPTKISFNLSGSDATIPGPSFLLMDTNDGTLNIPTSDASATQSSMSSGNRAALAANLADPRAAMGTMDGWPVSMPIVMPFEGAGLADGVLASGVVVAQLTEGLTGSPNLKKMLVNGTDYQVISDAKNDRLIIQFADSLSEKGEYIIALTDDLNDANGDALGMSSSYATLVSKSTTIVNDSIATAAQVTKGINAIFAQLGTANEDIIYSSWFTTQSVGDTLYATKAAIATGAGLGDFGAVWKDSANPNDVSLTGAYFMSVPASGQDYATALPADTNFASYIETNNGSDAAALVTAYALGTVTVSKGTVKLPYFLEKDASTWNTTPFESAMPSLAIVSNVLNGDNSDDASAVGQQLVAAGVDLTTLATDPAEQLKLVGLTLTKADGSQLDSERVITRYNPVPQLKSLEDVPFILFTPTALVGSPGDMELVIYQHGITSAKENAYAFAANVINGAKTLTKDIAVIAIDQPLHGERSLDATRSANVDPTAFLNLTYLPVGRDNLRQSMLDNMGLRAAASITQSVTAFAGTPLAPLANTAVTNPSLFGHSLGGITGFGTVAMANSTLDDAAGDAIFKFSRVAAANTGGQIANLLLGSNTFGPGIIAQVTSGTTDATKAAELVSSFAYAAQTVIDAVDPFNLVGENDLNGTNVLDALPIHMQQVKSDATVPNTVTDAPFAGTEPLATKLQLTTVDSASQTTSNGRNFTKFSDVGKHSTVISPQEDDFSDLGHTTEMQSQLVQFLAGSSDYAVSDTSVLE